MVVVVVVVVANLFKVICRFRRRRPEIDLESRVRCYRLYVLENLVLSVK